MKSALVSLDASHSKKRARKKNFTDAELKVLLQCIAAEADVVTSPATDMPTNELKAKAWERIAAKVSAFSGVERTGEGVREKWGYMKNAVAKQIDGHITADTAPKPLPYQEAIIAIVVRDKKKLKMDWGMETDSGKDQTVNNTSKHLNPNDLSLDSASCSQSPVGGADELSSPMPACLPEGVASISSLEDSCVRDREDSVRMVERGSLERSFTPVNTSQNFRKIKTLIQKVHSKKVSSEQTQSDEDDAYEGELFARYLKSEIIKNRAKKALMTTKKILLENMNRKVLLEIEKLERELGDSNDCDLNVTNDDK